MITSITSTKTPRMKWRLNLGNPTLLYLFLLVALSFASLLMLKAAHTSRLCDAMALDSSPQRGIPLQDHHGEGSKEMVHDDLLPNGFHGTSCLSRHDPILSNRPTFRKPSRRLVSELRSYEARHKRCAPHTYSYNASVEALRSNVSRIPYECRYIVWIPYSGLGNRVMSLTSAFLYALLTDRVLLVDGGDDVSDLFCEPFPHGSWLLPYNFPVRSGFTGESNDSFGNLLRNNCLNDSSSLPSPPPYVYVHLVHDYGDHDKLFFCEKEQSYLQSVPWLMMKSDNYYIPSLFMIPSFQQRLHDLFPEKDTVFHLLVRYLLHPTNSVWGLVTRFYEAYLSKADVKVGIQIRVFRIEQGPFKYILDQILSCTMNEHILPQVHQQGGVKKSSKSAVAVMIASLNQGYFEEIRKLYWENATVTGETISVHQPSFEGYQRMHNQNHNKKALAEMYLLSLCDKLVTSSSSTFGYVAQGLGALRPWILYKPENETAPDPPCHRGHTFEPCFHSPPFFDCRERRGADTGAMVPYVRHCEDVPWGLKLVKA